MHDILAGRSPSTEIKHLEKIEGAWQESCLKWETKWKCCVRGLHGFFCKGCRKSENGSGAREGWGFKIWFFRWLLLAVHSHLSTVQIFPLDLVPRHVKQRREVIFARSQSRMWAGLLVYQHSTPLINCTLKKQPANRLWLRNELQARAESMLDGIIMIYNYSTLTFSCRGWEMGLGLLLLCWLHRVKKMLLRRL